MFYVTVLTVYIITTLAKAVSERKMVGKINALPNTFVLEIDTNFWIFVLPYSTLPYTVAGDLREYTVLYCSIVLH